MSDPCNCWPDVWRPRELLVEAASRATAIRKLLSSFSRCDAASGLRDDAVALASLIETLARYGSKSNAAESIEVAERVELLIEALLVKVDAILAS